MNLLRTSCSRIPASLNHPSTINSLLLASRSTNPIKTNFSRFASSTPPRARPTSSSSGFTDAHRRHAEAQRQLYARRNRSLLLYSTATIILVGGLSYAAVPLYRVFCSATGYGGTPLTDTSKFGADRLIPIQQSERRIKVQFNADSSDSLPWSFSPQQKEVSVLPGETALAFYTATNNSDEDIIGIATYNVTPNQVSHWSQSPVRL